jgi:hypothetical protein
MSFFETKLSKYQWGFRPRRGCADVTVSQAQTIATGYSTYENVGRPHNPSKTYFASKITLSCLLDFSQAYDRVPPAKLLTKLERIGTPALLTRWLAAWLQQRTFQVQFEGATSGLMRQTQGIPQGAIVAPLLWAIFVDDLLVTLPEVADVQAYADDVTINCADTSFGTAVAAMRHVANICTTWAAANDTIISDKTVLLKYQRGQQPCEDVRIRFGDHDIPISLPPTVEACSQGKLLGVSLDPTVSQLTFAAHHARIEKKVTQRIRQLRTRPRQIRPCIRRWHRDEGVDG